MIHEDHYKKHEIIVVWEAIDADGKVFIYPMKPVWSERLSQWKCPYVDQDTTLSTVGLEKPSKGLTLLNSPLRREMPYEEYLRLMNKYR